MCYVRPSREWVSSPHYLRHASVPRLNHGGFRCSGKTAVFVASTLQQLEPVDGEVSVLVLCHTRELAFQIKNEYARFSKYLPNARTSVFYGGTPIKEDQAILKNKEKCPHIVVGTPGRIAALSRDGRDGPKTLKLGALKQFVLDECDKMLEGVG